MDVGKAPAVTEAAIKARIAKAWGQAENAGSTQYRQHFEGLARYWEDILREAEFAASPGAISAIR